MSVSFVLRYIQPQDNYLIMKDWFIDSLVFNEELKKLSGAWLMASGNNCACMYTAVFYKIVPLKNLPHLQIGFDRNLTYFQGPVSCIFSAK